MELKVAIEYALDNDAILFLGAGASVGALNQNNTPFKVGAELAHLLCVESGCALTDNLQMAAELFCDAKDERGYDGQQELINLLKRECSVKELSSFHKLYPTLPWKRIYTTNYDNIVEESYRLEGKKVSSYTLNSTRRDSSELEYIHINGYIENLNRVTLNNQFKLTDRSYNTSVFMDDFWGSLFIQDVKTYSAIIFVGFSLHNDLDIKRLISNYTSKDKCIFIVYEKEDDNNVKLLSKYGEVFKIGCNGFFDEVNEVMKTYTPKKASTLDNTHLTNFRQRHDVNKSYSKKPSDKTVLDYYTKGIHVQDLYYPLNDSYEALVKRDVVQKILEDIESNIDIVFIHADIGNGKSEVVEQIFNFAPAKYNIFVLQDNNEKIHKEVEMICSSDRAAIIIIENFFNYKDVFDIFRLHNSTKSIIFVLTARTSIYKNRYEAFIENAKTNSYDLNRLSDGETSELVRVFDNYGFYFSNNKSTEEVIRQRCARKLQSIMLELFNSSAITNELSKTIQTIASNSANRKYLDFITLSLLIKIMALDIDFYDLLNMFNVNTVDYGFAKNEHINELISFAEHDILIKSSALSVWLINQVQLQNRVIDLVVDIVKYAHNNYKANKKFERLLGNITSYKHLRFLFDELKIHPNEKLKLVNSLYENVKNLEYFKNRYFFWLQYSISALEMGDLSGSEMHFRASYAKCREGMTPFEIDNHYARLRFEKLLLSDTIYSSSVITELSEIHKLLTPSSAEADDEYYCYKMANAYYRRIFDKYFSFMNESERKRMKEIARTNYNLCKKFKIKNNNYDFVRQIGFFENEFLSLAFYESEKTDVYLANVTYILEYYLKVQFTKDSSIESGQIHLKSQEAKLFNIGQALNVKINCFNKKYNCWELAIVH